MYISDQQVDRLVAKASCDETSFVPPPDHADTLRTELNHRRAASMEGNVPLALSLLTRLFGLNTFEEQVVLVALAPDVDSRFGTLYAYLQDDITRRRPSVDLALRMLCTSPEQRLGALKAFSQQARLYGTRILRSPDAHKDEPLQQRALILDETIVDFLLETDGIDPKMAACFQRAPAGRALFDLRWSNQFTSQLLARVNAFLYENARSSAQLFLHFCGPEGTGKRTLAASLCKEVGLPFLCVDLNEVVARFDDFETGLRCVFRHAILSQSALFIANLDCLASEEERSAIRRKSFCSWLEKLSGLFFLGSNDRLIPRSVLPSHSCVSLDLPPPGLSQRRELWDSLITEHASANLRFSSDVDWSDVTSKFRMTPGEMERALDTAISFARLRNSHELSICAEDLRRGLNSQSNTRLNTLARKMTPRYSWEDIVLPPNALAQLRELCSQIKQWHTVYVDWGFDRKLSLGKGLCVLLCGQSGVGKTMAVEIIANELKLEAFKIDLSSVVSKYIGETEKNLSRVFHEAESSNAILFFDEADALFGKRSEIKDAHDRYANIEINYLLQRIEEFEGLVVLATNLRKNVDEAFFRRMQFVVEFPFPDAAHRYRLWRQHFPPEAPVAEDIDFSYLAQRFNFSGGNIKNVVVNAAFLAAEDGRVIRMEHVIRATKREYEKIGRLCTENEFAPYHTMLGTSGGAA
jgi:SpoVK/Ycf46/Vps4 family AAA+-type ATPase